MDVAETANGLTSSHIVAGWWSDLLRLFVSDRGLKLRLNIPDTLIIDHGCISVWYQTSDDGYINRVATTKATREAFRRRCEEKFTADACNPDGWIAVARSLGPGNQEISQLLRKDDLDELLSTLQDAYPSETSVRSPRAHSNGKSRRKAAPAEQPGLGGLGGLRCPHCLQIYVPPSLDQRFVATCVQEGDGLRCNTTVRLYSRRYLGNRDDGSLSPRSRGADDKDAEESRPLQDVRIKTDVRRAASALITYVEKAHGHRLVAVVAEFIRGLEGRIYFTAVHSTKWAQYISETTGLQSTEHAPAGGLAATPRQNLKPLQSADFPHITGLSGQANSGQMKSTVVADWIKEREREARLGESRSAEPGGETQRGATRSALISPRERKESPRGAGLVATSGHHPLPYTAFRPPSPQRGPGNPSTSGSHVSPGKRPQDGTGTRFWTYNGRDRKCDAELAATLTEEVEASREQVQHFYQELQATKRLLQEREESLEEQHTVYVAMVRQLTSQFLEAKNSLEAETRKGEALGEANQKLAAELAAMTRERDELRDLLRRERDAAMTSIVDHTEMQKKLKQGEAQLLKDLAASRAECAALQKSVDEEREVVAAVSRQLVDFRDRYNLLQRDTMRDGSVTARRTPAVIWDLPVPPGDGDQSAGMGGPVSPRGKVAIAVNVEDLLAAEEDGATQLNAVNKRLGGADEFLQEIYAFYSMLGKSYTDSKRPSMSLLQFGKFVRDIGLLKRQADGTGIAITPATCDAVFARVHVPEVVGGDSGEPTLSYTEFLESLVRLAAIRYTQPPEQRRGDGRPPAHLSKRLALLLEKDVLTRARRRLVTSAEKKKLGLTAAPKLTVTIPATPGALSARGQAATPIAGLFTS